MTPWVNHYSPVALLCSHCPVGQLCMLGLLKWLPQQQLFFAWPLIWDKWNSIQIFQGISEIRKEKVKVKHGPLPFESISWSSLAFLIAEIRVIPSTTMNLKIQNIRNLILLSKHLPQTKLNKDSKTVFELFERQVNVILPYSTFCLSHTKKCWELIGIEQRSIRSHKTSEIAYCAVLVWRRQE